MAKACLPFCCRQFVEPSASLVQQQHWKDAPSLLVSSRFSTRQDLLRQKASTGRLSSEFLGQKVLSLHRKCQHTTFPAIASAAFATPGAAFGAAAAPLQGRPQRVGECLVFPSFPKSRKPKAIVKFLVNPYDVTYDPAVSAQRIHKKFNDTLSILHDCGVPSLGLMPDDLSKLPVYSVGHSYGALMQVLIGCLCTENPGQLPKANAIVSFGNHAALDPVPSSLQTLIQTVQSSPLTNGAANFAAEAIKAVRNNPIPLPPGLSNADLQSVQQYFEQILGVFSQVPDGVLESTPSPAKNRDIVALKYAIPNNLLIKFTDDPIDETDLLVNSIQPRSDSLGGSFKKLVLTGTHLTPCAQDLKWEVGSVFTPADAVAQAVLLATLADLRNLAKRIAEWFDSLS